MPESHKQGRGDRLARVYQSLEGLCCGDAFGERFFIAEEMAHSLIDQKSAPAPPWIFTDDTMPLSSGSYRRRNCGGARSGARVAA